MSGKTHSIWALASRSSVFAATRGNIRTVSLRAHKAKTSENGLRPW
jgi:hypothetical protein